MRSSPSQESWPGSNPVGLQETELMPSDVQLDRTANIRAILGLLKAGPRTDRDIELSCFLSRYTRVKYMRALECAGIVERSRENSKTWQLTVEYRRQPIIANFFPGLQEYPIQEEI